RSVTVDGRAIEMTMVSTGVGPTLFAVGVARLPADLIRDAAAREKTMTYFREGLMRNIGATTNNAAEVKIARAGAPGVTGEQVSARGRTGTDGRATQLVARLALVDDRLYQVVALGAEGELPPEVLDTFFTSFRILI
ncbi:MAG TPA: hypothetical protein VFR86_02445, partial [Burkholderiaceae bacterium]|nr:hypothetical protein [Burkholderiaceae bacterium]